MDALLGRRLLDGEAGVRPGRYELLSWESRLIRS